MNNRIAFIDTTLPSAELLAATFEHDADIVALKSGEYVLHQINRALDHLPGHVHTIDIFCHAQPGRLVIGQGSDTSVIDAAALRQGQDALEKIGQALGTNGLIMLYGCSLGETQSGRDFLTTLNQLTGCGVAAATHPIGAENAGGSWELDIQHGHIHARSLSAPSYPATLGVITGSGYINGTNAGDTINGSALSDYINGQRGSDLLNGFGGNDYIFGDQGSDTLIGGTGNDYLSDYSNSIYQLLDGANVFHFEIDDGQDTIYSSSANDVIEFGAGISVSDLIVQSTTLSSFNTIYTISFVNSTDTISVNTSQYIAGPITKNILTIQFADGTTLDAAHIMQAFLKPTASSDVINGTPDADLIDGQAGNDILSGNDGNDTLIGGTGNDALSGGNGQDVYQAARGFGFDTINNLDSSYGNDPKSGVRGWLGNTDQIQFAADIATGDVSLTRSGNDLLARINGTNDQLTIQNYFLGGQNVVEQWAFADGTNWTPDVIARLLNVASDGADTLAGYLSADSLSGGAGNDIIAGFGGNDTLNGGIGNDVLTGGNGADVYLFGIGSGQDTINNLDDDTPGLNPDTIQLGAGITAAMVTLSRSGGNLLLSITGSTDTLTVTNVTSGDSYLIDNIRFADGTVWDQTVIKNTLLTGTAGNDSISGFASADVITGLAGDDTLSGQAGNDTLDGGAGNDWLDGGSGSDTYLFGVGSGQDTINNLDTSTGIDAIQLAAGITPADVIMTRSGNALEISLAGQTDQLSVNSFFSSDSYLIDAIKFSDGTTWNANTIKLAVLTGTNANNSITGYNTDDLLSGASGNDTLDGGAGNDTLDGGAGNDWLYGNAGSDTYLFGPGSGQDTISNIDSTPASIDVIQLAAGITPVAVTLSQSGQNLTILINGTTDLLTVSGYYNYVASGSSIDSIKFADGTTWDNTYILTATLSGTANADTLYGTTGNDTLNGQAGNDSLIGQAGNDSLNGGDGNDTLQGNAGDDTLNGGTGNDSLVGSTGSDVYTFNSGSGQDTIYDSDFSGSNDTLLLGIGIAPAGVTIGRTSNDLTLSINNSTDLLTIQGYFSPGDSFSIEKIVFSDGTTWISSAIRSQFLTGTSGNDVITGYSTNDPLSGLDGNDTLNGDSGNDTLNGGLGNDSLSGGYGSDTYVFAPGFGQDSINEISTSSSDIDVISLGAGITSGAVVLSEIGSDILLSITGTMDSIRIIGGVSSSAPDIDSIQFADGTAWDATTIQAKALAGAATSGNDSITGFSGASSLSGLAGNDTLTGTSYNDTFNGGTGNDSLQGSYGSDTYIFTAGDGQDTIYDYSYISGEIDTLQLGVGFTAANTTLSASGLNALLTFASSTDSVTVTYGAYSSSYGLEQINFADGTVWDSAYISAALGLGGGTPSSGSTITGTAGADFLYGTSYADSISGLAGNDYLSGSGGADTLDGGIGNDSLQGGSDGDIYIFQTGFGNDTISENDTSNGAVDTIQFGPGILSSSVTVARSSNNLVVQVTGTSDQVTVQNFFDTTYATYFPDYYTIEQIKFDDGTTWSKSAIFNAFLTGTAGNDAITGYDSNDRLTGNAGHDTLDGGAGNDTLNGGVGNDSLIGNTGTDTYLFDIGAGLDIISSTSADGTDILQLEAGVTTANVLMTRSGLDLLVGINGQPDQVTLQNYFSGGSLTVGQFDFADGSHWTFSDVAAKVLAPTAGNDSLAGFATDDSISGAAGNDTLVGNAGNDTLDGGIGNDSMAGGLGDDIYLRDSATDVITENVDEGHDTVITSINYTLVSNLEDLVLASGATNGGGNALANGMIGNAANNVLAGAAGDDTLNGGAGNDTMYGGLGNDTFVVDAVGDSVVENPGEGTDLVRSSLTYTLGNNVENLQLLTGAALNGAGNALNNLLIGNSGANILNGAAGDDTVFGAQGTDNLFGGIGNDTLDGGKGDDTLSGNEGDDTYVVDSVLDVVNEVAGQGNDTVITDLSLRLQANVENMAVDASRITNIRSTNADLYHTLIVEGNALNNTITGSSINDSIRGGAGNDVLYGYAGNDSLDGGTGADAMIGGAGSDSYYRDSTGDVMIEAVDSGYDTVFSTLNYTLGANLDSLVLVASATNGGGNELDNIIYGNTLDNVLAGADGNDFLSGSTGNDTLYGGTGNDTLSGGAGNDAMYGQQGDDTYFTDVATDLISENAGEGIDTVVSSYNMTLGTNLENLTLATGSVATTGGGNALANVLLGNGNDNVLAGAAGNDALDGDYGNDTLDGGTGDDTMTGDYGDDLFMVDSSADVLIESYYGGLDTAQSSVTFTLNDYVENLILTGTASLNGTGNFSDNQITGNSGNNVLTGLDGNDTLDGGTGNDTMQGGTGNDTYYRDVVGDVITENAGEGTDTAISSVNYTLGANLENLTLAGTATNGGGNELDNEITGNANNNLLAGAAGNDTLDGQGGADAMYGGLGDDVYYVDNAGDLVSEAAGQGHDVVISTISYSLVDTDGAGANGGNVEDLALFGTADINGIGNSLNNIIYANSGANLIDGGSGNDSISFELLTSATAAGVTLNLSVVNGAGQAMASGISGNDSVVGIENIIGSDYNDNLTGTAGVNRIEGGFGNDTLNGAVGADTMIGGFGDDSYYRDNAADVITENALDGTDTVFTSLSYTLGANLENLTLLIGATNGGGNALDNYLVGNAANNVLSGAAGNDTLDGSTGNDSMYGGLGDDVYFRDSVADAMIENPGEGIDKVITTLNYTLGANLENLELSGSATNGGGNALDNQLTGNALNNVLAGAAGNDTLDGAAGADSMYGGIGDDTYVRDSAADVIVENASEGIDTVLSSLDYTLGTNLEYLELVGVAINGTGNTLDNWIVGNDLNNVLAGVAGNDTLDGGIGNDTLYGGAGDNVVMGGIGDDTYYHDSATETLVESWATGTDTVITSVNNYTLEDNLESLVLGTSVISGSGNSLDNLITGNTANNVLSGGKGDDMLDGGSGADSMYGGLGQDTYVRDSVTDVIVESAQQGIDTVNSSLNYTLGANLENLTLLGSATNGGGNALDNTLIGNAANNLLAGAAGNDTLDGGTGNDSLYGGTGDDVYVLDSSADVIVENANEGTDLVISAVNYTLGLNLENLALQGAAVNGGGNVLDNLIEGTNANNVLSGAAGNDTLFGGLGNDTLYGGTGNDTFVFDTALGATNIDVIADFNAGDRFMLDNDVFRSLTGVGDLGGAEFFKGAGLTGSSEDLQSVGIYYDTSTGDLYYDADGYGGAAAVKFATLTGAPAAISSANFLVID